MFTFGRALTLTAMACAVATAFFGMPALRSASDVAVSAPSAASLAADNSSFPLQLKMADRFAYRRIFNLQAQGKWDAADALIAGLHNPVLLGKVQAQRYLHPGYISRKPELAMWLRQHPTWSETSHIAKLAAKKGVFIAEATAYKPLAQPSPFPTADRKTELRFGNTLVSKYLPNGSPLRRHIRELLKAERRTKALEVLERARGLSALQFDVLRWSIAGSYYNHGEYAPAARLAAASAARSGKTLPALHWLAAMAAWHQRDIGSAYQHLKIMAQQADDLTLSDAAAASFWAYRAAQALGLEHAGAQYLAQAAATGDTFYGIQAGQIIANQSLASNEEEDTSSLALASLPGAEVILALSEIGQHQQAAQEWRFQLAHAHQPQHQEGLLTLGRTLQLPAENPVLSRVNAGQYPRPHLVRQAEHMADPALLYAMMKQESGFNSDAESHRGAGGVMQIMPATAKYLMAATGKSANWQHTADNIQLGQAYLEVLGRQPHIGDNLIYMLAAYNAGPGVVGKWLREGTPQNDPLLFIESIPYTETRSYVLQVLRNYWVYRSQMPQTDTPALPEMLAGEWPRYAALDIRKLASLR